MLAVLKKKPQKRQYSEPQDIIVTKYETKTEAVDSLTKMTKKVPIRVNITKLVNETKKLVKQDMAAKKIVELANEIVKESNK